MWRFVVFSFNSLFASLLKYKTKSHSKLHFRASLHSKLPIANVVATQVLSSVLHSLVAPHYTLAELQTPKLKGQYDDTTLR